MAAKNLTRLNVALALTTGAFTKGINGAVKDVQEFGAGLKSAIMGPLGAITGLLAGGGIAAGIKMASDRIDGLAKSADRLGVATESLAGLRLATDEAGGSAEALEKGMSKLQKTVVDATNGNKAARESIEGLGLSVSQLASMRADEQFKAVADAVNKLGSANERTAATMAIFGEGGAALANTLALGSAGLEQATKDAQALGLAVSRVDAAKVEEANDAFGRIGKVGEGLFNKLTVAIAPFVTAFSEAFTQFAIRNDGFKDAIQWVIDLAIDGAAFIADAWQGLGIIWQACKVGVARIGEALIDVADGAVNAAQWIGTKFSQAWDLVAAAGNVLWNTLKVGWAGLKVPVSDFVQYTAGQLAGLLETASTAAYQFSAKMGTSLQEAAAAVRVSTGAMGADARKNLSTTVDGLSEASQKTAAATTALFSSVTTEGSLMLRLLKEDFANLTAEEMAKLDNLRNSDRLSDRLRDLIAQTQQEAEIRAQARAAEVTATQEQYAMLDQAEMDSLAAREQARIDQEDREAADRQRNISATLSGSSSMFANLAKLQDTHNKTAQRIGKIFAKSKIATDTASAAMGAYSAMAAIPIIGPGLGIAAAAAAVLAGGIQMANVDKGSVGSGGGGGPVDTSTTNLGGVQAPVMPSQTLYVQGDYLTPETLDRIIKEGRERGFSIDGVRRA